MTTFKVFGNPDAGLEEVNFGSGLKNFKITEAVQLTTNRAASNAQVIKGLKKDDIIELILEGDVHRWITVGEFENKYKNQFSRSAGDGTLEIPSQLTVGSTTRGPASVALTALRVLKFDPAEMAAERLAKAFDEKLLPKPGLFRFDQGLDVRGAEINTQIKARADKPVLLFIHGTFSSTVNGYGKLSEHTQTWDTLKQVYGDQIYGYDHKTLSLSPFENAIDLVQKLPDKITLHIVTHSRGGLVGELLCRANRKGGKEPFDEKDLEIFADDAAAAKQLSELSKLLKKKKGLKVERFVRVACPARGTTLASKRLDDYLTLMVNVIGKVFPANPVATGIGVLTDLLLEVKKQSRNASSMPGLAAMDPASNFIKMINRHDMELDGDLSVIAGDIEKSGVLGTIAVSLADLFYLEDHDLVVNTQAMFAGPIRMGGRYFFHKGPTATHVTYFANARTAQITQEALTLPFNELAGRGFQALKDPREKPIPELESGKRTFQKRSNLNQPVVYILPGIMGTHLSVHNKRIWFDPLAIANGNMNNLNIDNGDIRPQALMDSYYGKLVDYLSATHEVIPFPYDWRKSILVEANRFADMLEARLAKLREVRSDQPIQIIAHSMGGIVTRAMIALRPNLWNELCERKGARFIMLGTPNRGSYKIPSVLFGLDDTFLKLAFFDAWNPAGNLLKILARYPGLLQLLPMPEDGKVNFTELAAWDTFPNYGRQKWARPQKPDLDQAKRLHEVLDQSASANWDTTVYVAGVGRRAPVGVEIEDGDTIVVQVTDHGDGTVPWESGIPAVFRSDQVYYMHASHGDMPRHRNSFSAIYDLLTDGKTSRLSHTRPVDRGQEVRYVLREQGLEMYPTADDLEAALMGATPIHEQEQPLEQVKVSVVHGNLSFCSNPVAIGHYEGDDLFSAEREMDQHLDGRLSVRLRLGLYPGVQGSVHVCLNEGNKKPGGAIIVGLGKAGELSPNKLTNSFASALREFGVKAMEHRLADESGELKISTLLIGAGGTGLSVANSVNAILAAVLQANKSFEQIKDTNPAVAGPQYKIRIAEVEFVELFKDQAILAVKALEPLTENNLEFMIEPKLRTMQGGWKRVAFAPSAGWWGRLHIRAEELRDNSLIFSVPSDRARSEESRLEVQRRSLDRLIEQAVQFPTWDQSLATSIFELLLPNRIKGSFKDMDKVVFVVDKEAAHYPWELLYDRRSGQDKPLVIDTGMIRQFSTFSFEERVIDVRNRDVLVVGNPKDRPIEFPNLPGAEQEATLVAAKFTERGFNVYSEINSVPSSIMNQLFSKDYRVLHLAGHGVFKYEYAKTSDGKAEVYTGMVLGDGIFLTANEIKQKMEIPELVFINCCHLAKFSSPEEDLTPKYAFNLFAASLSEELIKMGVKAVVAAGWAVDDAAALTFAEVFYTRMLQGDRFGDATREARKATHKLHGERTNTWGAYQCYGDPSYRLVIDGETEGGAIEKFVDIEEAIAHINQLYELAKTASTQRIENIRSKLKRIEASLATKEYEPWLDNARLQDALGEAFGEVYYFDEATKYYNLAIRNEKSLASIRAIEQCANLEMRLAVQEYEKQPRKYAASRRKIKKHIGKLSQLNRTLGETIERLSIIGGGYKRLAHIAGPANAKDCNSSLKSMQEYYDQAYKIKKSTYPLGNSLTAELIRLLRAEKTRKSEFGNLRRRIKLASLKAIEDASGAKDDFWAVTGITNLKLLAYICEFSASPKGSDISFHDELLAEYKTAWKQYGSARELNSIIEQYAFLVATLSNRKNQAKLRAVFESILESLKSRYNEVSS